MDKVLGNEKKAVFGFGSAFSVYPPALSAVRFGQYTTNHSNFDSAFSIPENFDLYSPLALAVLPGASHYHV